MLDEQEKQGNKRDVSVFEENPSASSFGENGFYWEDLEYGYACWYKIINEGKYPKEPKKYPRVV